MNTPGNRNYDVIVVGGGGAGMAAALTASSNGASVAIVEAGPQLGGSTALSGGVYYAAGTSVQRARGILDDTPDEMFDYYMTLNQHRVEPALVRRLCNEAESGLDWLMSLGVVFKPEALYKSGVDSVARGHHAEGDGAAIAEALDRAVSQAGIDVALNSRVDRLLVDGGNVYGVNVCGDNITANSVIITTGGLGGNRELHHIYYPEAAAYGDDWTWYIGSPTVRGDGLILGQAADADITGHNRGLLLTTPGFSRDLEPYVPGWLVYVNREGRRFINETTEYAVMSGAITAQTGRTCFAIFDESSRAAATPAFDYEEAAGAGFPFVNYVADRLEEMAAKGKIYKANTISELAELAGIRASALASSISTYNASCTKGSDPEFFKEASIMRPIQVAPFYAAEVRPAVICLTSVGLRINSSGQVLSRDNLPISGLFAAGETTGGVMGERYVGGGNSITNAIVFGRIAGRSATTASA